MLMSNTPDRVIAILTERNYHRHDDYSPKANGRHHSCHGGMQCTNISCNECPFSTQNDPHRVITMGDLREELQNRRISKYGQTTVTESHKGDSGMKTHYNIGTNEVTTTESHKGGGGGGIYVTGKHETIKFDTMCSPDVDTAVFHPKHYEVIEGIEAIEVIARSMTVEQFKGYCLGNIIKYRMRLGSKDAVEQDLKKAQNYKDIFETYKELCYDYNK